MRRYSFFGRLSKQNPFLDSIITGNGQANNSIFTIVDLTVAPNPAETDTASGPPRRCCRAYRHENHRSHTFLAGCGSGSKGLRRDPVERPVGGIERVDRPADASDQDAARIGKFSESLDAVMTTHSTVADATER